MGLEPFFQIDLMAFFPIIQVAEYDTIFACSDVAVVEKKWLLICLTKGRLVSIMPFLQHDASREQLSRLDYGNDLL